MRSALQLGHHLGEALAGAAQAGVGGEQRDGELGGHLLDRDLVDLAQAQDGAIPGAHRLEGAQDQAAGCSACRVSSGPRRCPRGRFGPWASAPDAPQVVAGDVEGDAGQPGAGWGSRPIRGPPAAHHQEHVLGQVLHVGGPDAQPAEHADEVVEVVGEGAGLVQQGGLVQLIAAGRLGFGWRAKRTSRYSRQPPFLSTRPSVRLGHLRFRRVAARRSAS